MFSDEATARAWCGVLGCQASFGTSIGYDERKDVIASRNLTLLSKAA